MKRFLSIILAILFAVGMVGCNNQSTKLAWSKYPDIGFTEYLTAGFNHAIDGSQDTGVVDFRIHSEEGWENSTLNEKSLFNGNKAYTYILDMYSDEGLYFTMHFFMEYVASSKNLRARGSMITVYDNYAERTLSASETNEFLTEMLIYQ